MSREHSITSEKEGREIYYDKINEVWRYSDTDEILENWKTSEQKKWTIEQNVFSSIRVENIEAKSPEEATKKAKKIIDEKLKRLGPNVKGQPFFIEGKNTTFFFGEREIYFNEKDGKWRDCETDELIKIKD